MAVAIELVKQLRELTGAGVKDCRDALEASGGDLEQAAAQLRERGLAAAAKKSGRETLNGVLDIYSHGDGRVGVMVEVNCETDFVARTKEFRTFAHEVALQVAAASPRWVRPEDVPAEVVEEERAEARRQAQAEGKPAAVIEQIIAGRLDKFLAETCLLQQPYIRDEARTLGEMLQEMIATTGENVTVRRFVRWTVGEEDS
ncbi:MAG TPA: translation elongation factor Ts [Anaerolineales bacterium]|nr:translation elongation factor Ts [Anaerolineales bacterium]